MTAPLNGNGTKILWWLISLLTGGLVGIASHHFTANAEHGSRLAVLEHESSNTEHRLRSIENKIDKLLEHQRRLP
jgi:hypothetical protein